MRSDYFIAMSAGALASTLVLYLLGVDPSDTLLLAIVFALWSIRATIKEKVLP